MKTGWTNSQPLGLFIDNQAIYSRFAGAPKSAARRSQPQAKLGALAYPRLYGYAAAVQLGHALHQAQAHAVARHVAPRGLGPVQGLENMG